MKRKPVFWVTAMVFIYLLPALTAKGQADDTPRYEVGAEFTSITKPDVGGGKTEIGAGGRFTFNFSSSIAIEAVTNFFPHSCNFCGLVADNSGNITQGLFGVKAGKRFEKWGIFAKGRPGFVSFSKGDSSYAATGPGTFQFVQQRATHLALDLGGVLEFYPSKHIVTRFDAGDTLINYRAHNSNFISFDPTGGITLVPFRIPGETRNNFQFSAGVGFRF